MSLFKLLLTLLVVVVGCLNVSGQAASSPFSGYGVGDTYGDALVHNQGMGGVGISNPQRWFLNAMNPALLVNNRLTVFQAGAVGDNRRLTDGTQKEKRFDGNLNYLTMGFPLLRNKLTGESKVASSFGLLPYSNVNYSFSKQETIAPDNFSLLYIEKGKGGLSEFYSSTGVRLNRYLSAGLKTSFLFGSVTTEFKNILFDPNQPIQYLVNVHELQTLKGTKFMPGLHFRKDSILIKYTLNIGAVAEFRTRIRSDLDRVLEKSVVDGPILLSDTVKNSSQSYTYLPQRFTLGVSFGRPDRWTLATDFSFLKPSGKTIGLGLDQISVNNGWRWAAGAELTPDARSLGNYLKRITYRGGISSEKGVYLVNGNAVKDFGINFGLSLPVNRVSSLDIAFRSGRRGDVGLNGIEEKYFKIYFGVTFNDQWFIKRRFD